MEHDENERRQFFQKAASQRLQQINEMDGTPDKPIDQDILNRVVEIVMAVSKTCEPVKPDPVAPVAPVS